MKVSVKDAKLGEVTEHLVFFLHLAKQYNDPQDLKTLALRDVDIAMRDRALQ